MSDHPTKQPPPPTQPPPPNAWARLRQQLIAITPRQMLRVVMVLSALLTIGWLVWVSWNLLLPFQIGLVLAYLLLPLVNMLGRSLPRGLAVGVVFLGALLLIGLALAVVLPILSFQVSQLVAAIPQDDSLATAVETEVEKVVEYVGSLDPAVQQTINETLNRMFETIQSNLIAFVQTASTFVFGTLLSAFGTFAFLLGFFVIPFWLWFVLVDQPRGLLAVDYIVPPAARPDFWAVLTIADRSFSRYVRGQLLLAIVIGGTTFVALTVLQMLGVGGVQYPLLFAFFSGVTEIIPFVGPIIGSIPPILLAFTDSWQSGVIVSLTFLVIHQIGNNFLVPKVIGDSVDIHPAVLIALLIALTQFGFVWFLLAAPLAAALRDLYRYAYGRLSDPPQPAGVLPGKPFETLRSTPAWHNNTRPAPYDGTPHTTPPTQADDDSRSPRGSTDEGRSVSSSASTVGDSAAGRKLP